MYKQSWGYNIQAFYIGTQQECWWWCCFDDVDEDDDDDNDDDDDDDDNDDDDNDDDNIATTSEFWSTVTISFWQELVNYFDFHNYDLKGASSGRKLDPRRRKAEVQVSALCSISLLLVWISNLVIYLV